MAQLNDDRLNWLAAQYVLGELSPVERVQFEDRLADDPTACQAVAEAVQLTMTLRAAVCETIPASLPVSRSIQPTPRHSWLAFAGAATAAASLICATSFWPSSWPSSPRVTPVALADRSAAELVSLWRTGSATVDADLDEADVEVAESGQEVAVPGWLLAAVSLERDKAVDVQPENRQETGL